MATDSTFDFERRRNRPVKYDRELMTKTLFVSGFAVLVACSDRWRVQAMKRVQEIKKAREERFYKARCAANALVRSMPSALVVCAA